MSVDVAAKARGVASQIIELWSEVWPQLGRNAGDGAYDTLWKAKELLYDMADRIEERDQLVEDLAKTMCDGVAERVSTFPWGDDRSKWNREIYRQAARAAIEAGWTKAPL